MKKVYLVSLLAVLLLAGIAAAHRDVTPGNMRHGMQMMSFETYDELIKFREESGRNAMPRIQSEEDFGRMLEMRQNCRNINNRWR